MFKSDFIFALKQYKKLKDFIKENFQMEEQDMITISNGEIGILHWRFGESNYEAIPIEKILENLDEDIMF